MGKTEYAGIDYGMGQANVDKETGIHYGVIPMNALSEFAHESFEGVYGDPTCPVCGTTLREVDGELICNSCKEDKEANASTVETYTYQTDEYGIYPESPLYFECTDKDYEATMGEDGDIFITKSPFYTNAQYCSPCAPGACYLTNPCEDGPKAYCLCHDWFDGDMAPYPVFRVSDDSIVMPEGDGGCKAL